MIYLERAQLQALKDEAHALGISLAELVRRIVARHQQGSDGVASPTNDAYQRLVAIGASGRDDVGDRHDAVLGDALARDHAR
jgi:hypothetical protein